MADLRCYLTKSGIAAENNAKQFGTTLKITEMVFDGSYLADEENPENLTEVINPVLTVPCSTSISDDGQTLSFKGSILVEQGGFNVWGIGLKTDSGVLYGYARSKGDKILTADEGATESVRYAVDIITKNSDVIEIKVNQSTVYADLEDVDNAVKAHEAKPDPHEQYLKKSDANKSLYSTSTDFSLVANIGSVTHIDVRAAILRYIEVDDGFLIGGEIKINFNSFLAPTDDAFLCDFYIPELAKEYFGVEKMFSSACGTAVIEPSFTSRDYTPTATKIATGPTHDSFRVAVGELLGQSVNAAGTSQECDVISMYFSVTCTGKIKV